MDWESSNIVKKGQELLQKYMEQENPTAAPKLLNLSSLQ